MFCWSARIRCGLRRCEKRLRLKAAWWKPCQPVPRWRDLPALARGKSFLLLLVDRNDADGLLETLAELTSDTASPEVTLLVLGRDAQENFDLGVIAAADRQAIAASLAVRHFPAERNEPTLPTVELLEVVTGAMIETRYQPIVRIADRTTMAVEVLARLNHPTHGTVTPDWFVPRFEDAGLSFTLTDLVSTRALADLTGPGFTGLGLAMALNYPLKVLSHPEAAANLDERRESLGLTPNRCRSN